MTNLPEQSTPTIEKISSTEVYLLDFEKNRVKRICGVQRANQPPGHVCLKSAGDGTDHPGWGPCEYHNRAIPNARNTSLWFKMNREAGLPATLGELLDNAEEIEESTLSKVDEDIRLLYALQSYMMRDKGTPQKPKDLTEAEVDIIMKLSDRILKAKDLRAKLDKETKLDSTTIKEFINQVFQVIHAEVPAHLAKRVMAGVLNNVITPFKTQGRIVGNSFDYQAESPVNDLDFMKDGLE